MFAPYIPNRGDFRIVPGSLGVAFRVEGVGTDVIVASPDEGEAAIQTIIDDETERVTTMLATMPAGVCF